MRLTTICMSTKGGTRRGARGRGTDSEALDDAPVLVDSRDFHVCAMHQGKGSGALT